MIAFRKHLLSACLALAAVFASACTTGLSERKNNTVDPVGLSQDNAVDVQELASGLNHPWGMAFLPDGRLLVTEREGRLRILDKNKKLSEPLEGVPEVFGRGQGGLLDVAVDPDFENNRYVYLSFSESGDNNTASTALGRGRLDTNRLGDFTVIFRQEPKADGPNHFGGRILFSSDGMIFLTMGERFKFQPAQDNSNGVLLWRSLL